MRACNRCFFFSSYSSACNFSLACCFFSMSVRRFCAAEDELWDKVPSRAPNNLCPRLRSSSCPLLRRSDAWSCPIEDSEPKLCPLLFEFWLNRGLLELSSVIDDCLRFADIEGGDSSTGSGRMTADATALENTYLVRVGGKYHVFKTYSCASAILVMLIIRSTLIEFRISNPKTSRFLESRRLSGRWQIRFPWRFYKYLLYPVVVELLLFFLAKN